MNTIVIVSIAILTAIVLFYNLICPFVLEPGCFINSNACIKISYYAYNNSVLAEIQDSGIWIWYNGDKAYVYGQPVGQLCDDPKNFEAAYSVNIHSGKKEGYKCVITLDAVRKFYSDNNVKKSSLVKYVGKNRDSFDIYALLNYLDNLGIINL